MSEQIRKTFVLKYKISLVQKAIEDACLSSIGSYQIKNRNVTFNSYSIALVKMLSVLTISLQLKELSTGETEVDLSAVAGPQLSRVPAFSGQMIDEFLDKVGGFVSGKLIVQKRAIRSEANRKTKIGRAVVAYIILAAIIFGVVYLIFH